MTSTRPVPVRRLRSVVAALAGAALLLGGAPAYAAPAPDGRAPRDAQFRIATFNILGSQHTEGADGWGPGTRRARIAARALEHKRIDVAGLQEVQADQLRVLRNRLDGYAIWPKKALGGGGVRLQIAYRTAKFQLLDTGRIFTTFDHQRRPIPWVLLKNRRSDRQLYVVDVHNSPRGQEADRDRATRKQIRLVKALRATHRAVFLVGDMNEREEIFCKVVRGTDLRAADGGSFSAARGCRPPSPMRIDWVFGGGRLGFSGYRADYGPLVRRASDHHLISSLVTLGAKRQG